MQIKSELRKEAKRLRSNIPEKKTADNSIVEKLFSMDEYKDAKTILCYASLENEIDTDVIINRAINDNKRVALPFCRDNEGNMDFYCISSLDQLNSGSFNVREPNPDEFLKLTDFSNSIIIVPALMFDRKGYRLGYGKGYYDRFLNKYNQISIGLCYDELLNDELPADEFDKNVDIIITQSNIINCKNGGRNG